MLFKGTVSSEIFCDYLINHTALEH